VNLGKHFSLTLIFRYLIFVFNFSLTLNKGY
jgi:hypothetical protein